MVRAVLVLVAGLTCAVLCKPLENFQNDSSLRKQHDIQKRFINPMFNLGVFSETDSSKIRTKRSSEDECEKLQLCKLHARSQYNFFAAYELYFVNKENARLWDHRAHSLADCEARYGLCDE